MVAIKVERKTSKEFRRRIPRRQPWYVTPTFLVNLKVNLRWVSLRIAVPNPFRLLYLRGVRRRQDEFRAGILGMSRSEFKKKTRGLWAERQAAPRYKR